VFGDMVDTLLGEGESRLADRPLSSCAGGGIEAGGFSEYP